MDISEEMLKKARDRFAGAAERFAFTVSVDCWYKSDNFAVYDGRKTLAS